MTKQKTYKSYDLCRRKAEDGCPGAARMGTDYEIYDVAGRCAWRLLSDADFDLRTGARTSPAGGWK